YSSCSAQDSHPVCGYVCGYGAEPWPGRQRVSRRSKLKEQAIAPGYMPTAVVSICKLVPVGRPALSLYAERTRRRDGSRFGQGYSPRRRTQVARQCEALTPVPRTIVNAAQSYSDNNDLRFRLGSIRAPVRVTALG